MLLCFVQRLVRDINNKLEQVTFYVPWCGDYGPCDALSHASQARFGSMLCTNASCDQSTSILFHSIFCGGISASMRL